MDIFVSVLIGMMVGAVAAVAIAIALSAYHVYQREVSARFNSAKKEMLLSFLTVKKLLPR